MTEQFVSGCCRGEKCKCGAPAAHKIGEVIFDDDPNPNRHELTAYLCDPCFKGIMGYGPINPITKAQ